MIYTCRAQSYQNNLRKNRQKNYEEVATDDESLKLIWFV